MDTEEILETGFGDDTPGGDNLLNDFVRGEAEGFGALARARGDDVVDDPELGLLLADGGSAAPFGNVAVMRRPAGADEWPAVAARLHEHFGRRPGGPFLVFSAWPTADLRPHGFDLVGHPPLMFRLPAPLPPRPLESFEIREVRDEPGAHGWERVLVDGYPIPELQPVARGAFLPARALAAPGWHHYVGYLDGKAVATASAYLDARHVHVEFVAALPETRGRGIGQAITAAATGAAPSLPAMLIASDLGKPTYERLGYVSLLRFTLWAGHRRRGT